MDFFTTNATIEGLATHSGWRSIPTFHTLAAGTVSLSNTSTCLHFFSGTVSGQILQLPDATTLQNGHRFDFYNNSSTVGANIDVHDFSGTSLVTMFRTSAVQIILMDNSTAAGIWVIRQQLLGVASGILNYNIVSSTPFATTSATDVVITGFSLTPESGTYSIWYSASATLSSGSASDTWTVYKAGAAVTDSLRTSRNTAAGSAHPQGTQTIVQVNGSQTIDVRVHTSGGTLTINQRSLLLIRLGN